MKVTELTQCKLCLLIQKITMLWRESAQNFSPPEVRPCLRRTRLKELQMPQGTNKSFKTGERVKEVHGIAARKGTEDGQGNQLKN